VGPDVLQAFLDSNGLARVVRAHEMVQNGWEGTKGHNGHSITIFSASNYGKSGNQGAIACVRSDMSFAVLDYWRESATPRGVDSYAVDYAPKEDSTGNWTSVDQSNDSQRGLHAFLFELLAARKESLLQEFQRLDEAAYKYSVQAVKHSGRIPVGQWARAMKKVFPELLLPWPEMCTMLGMEKPTRFVNYVDFLERLQGKVSRSGELNGLYNSLGPLQYLFHFLDADSTGNISREEFETFWESCKTALREDGLYEEVMAGFDEEAAKVDVDKLFSTLDLNGDGNISFNELFEASRSLHVNEWLRSVPSQEFEKGNEVIMESANPFFHGKEVTVERYLENDRYLVNTKNGDTYSHSSPTLFARSHSLQQQSPSTFSNEAARGQLQEAIPHSSVGLTKSYSFSSGDGSLEKVLQRKKPDLVHSGHRFEFPVSKVRTHPCPTSTDAAEGPASALIRSSADPAPEETADESSASPSSPAAASLASRLSFNGEGPNSDPWPTAHDAVESSSPGRPSAAGEASLAARLSFRDNATSQEAVVKGSNPSSPLSSRLSFRDDRRSGTHGGRNSTHGGRNSTHGGRSSPLLAGQSPVSPSPLGLFTDQTPPDQRLSYDAPSYQMYRSPSQALGLL